MNGDYLFNYYIQFLLSIMNSIPQRSKTSKRFINPKIKLLLEEMMQQSKVQEISSIKTISEDQKMHYSCSLKASREAIIQNRPQFNNKTKEGELIDLDLKPIPYFFVPRYKNDTFIMPDRVFEKGKAGRRFIIKMKDTSICSFRGSQPDRIAKSLHKNEKEQTIISRQNEEYNRIINENDGKVKAQTMKWHLKTRKRMNPVHASQFFSSCEPMLEPKDPQEKEIRKISLSKTYDFRNKWRPVTRGTDVFSATVSNSLCSHQHHISSVR